MVTLEEVTVKLHHGVKIHYIYNKKVKIFIKVIEIKIIASYQIYQFLFKIVN